MATRKTTRKTRTDSTAPAPPAKKTSTEARTASPASEMGAEDESAGDARRSADKHGRETKPRK